MITNKTNSAFRVKKGDGSFRVGGKLLEIKLRHLSGFSCEGVAEQSLRKIVQFEEVFQMYPIIAGGEHFGISNVVSVPMGKINLFDAIICGTNLA